MYKKYETLRNERGLTDYRVSLETGIAPSTLSDWKNGISKPKVDKLLAIARLFNVSIEELIDAKEEEVT